MRFALLRLWLRLRSAAALAASYVAFVAWWCSCGVVAGACAVVAGVFWVLSDE